VWSDECSVKRSSGRQRSYVFRIPQQKWDKDKINTYKKDKWHTVMVWASFSGALGRSDLVVIERDKESPKGGYSARSYLQILDDQIPRVYEPGFQFMQDNAPIHKSKLVAKWFKENVVDVINWPPYSPDLNPIEHAWVQLKEMLHKQFPEIAYRRGSKEEVIKKLSKALVICWNKIAPAFFESLIDSMEERCDAVIEANGWHTRF
jgi:hypothetical protein